MKLENVASAFNGIDSNHLLWFIILMSFNNFLSELFNDNFKNNINIYIGNYTFKNNFTLNYPNKINW